MLPLERRVFKKVFSSFAVVTFYTKSIAAVSLLKLPQRYDWLQGGCTLGWIIAEEHPHRARKSNRNCNNPWLNQDRPVEAVGYAPGCGRPAEYAENASGCAYDHGFKQELPPNIAGTGADGKPQPNF